MLGPAVSLKFIVGGVKLIMTSSPDKSLGSNLQWEVVALSSAMGFSMDSKSKVIKPDKKIHTKIT